MAGCVGVMTAGCQIKIRIIGAQVGSGGGRLRPAGLLLTHSNYDK